MSNNSIWPIDRNLSDASTPSQCELGSYVNEGLLDIPPISKAEASPSDCITSYLGHSFGVGRVLPLYRDAVGVFYSPSRQGLEGVDI